MSFDYLWPNPGDGDYLTVFFGNTLLFSSLGLDFASADFVSSGLIGIGEFASMTDQLLFWLNSVGDPNAEVDIRDLTFYSSSATAVPEPSSIALLVSAVGLYLLFSGLANDRGTSRGRRMIIPQERFVGPFSEAVIPVTNKQKLIC
jgi:hypothetical protein